MTLRLRLAVLACAASTLGAGGATAATFTLRGGLRVRTGRNASFELRLDGRPLFATSSAEAPRAHVFDESVETFAAQWIFTRGGERTEAALSRVKNARRRKGAVRVKLESRRGFDGTRRSRIRGMLTVTPDPDGERTNVRLELAEPRPGQPAPRSITLPVRCDAGATFHGFGEQYNAIDQRGEAFPLLVSEQGLGRDPDRPQLPTNGTRHTTYFPMPYWLDARGWGVLVRTDHRVEVALCTPEHPDVARIEVVSGEPLDLVVFHGPTPLDVIRQLGDEVGRPKAPPSWAYDLWVSKQGGTRMVRDTARALRALDIPAGVIWSQDWTGTRTNFDGGLGVQYRWQADAGLYPDLAGLVSELHATGFRFLAYVNPFVDPGLPDHFAEMAARGLLLRRPDGTPYTSFAPNFPRLSAAHPDLANPEARAYVEAAFRRIVTDYGVDGWMADFGEWVPLDAANAAGTDPVAHHNAYPVAWHRASRAALDAVRPDGDWVTFARSGWRGVQRHSMIHWAGDQETDWSPFDGLPTVVPALLNLGLSGVPFVTHDIAGFSGTTAPPSTKELWQRWTELGAFTPIMRTHEGADRTNNWSWDRDAETTAHFRRFARVHQALGPALRALAADAAVTSAPLVRALFLEFPDDAASRGVSDQFLLGSDLLVAPVVTPGATTRSVYLPPGVWYHVWTGERIDGPVTRSVAAPIGSPPVFSRDRDRPDLRAIE